MDYNDQNASESDGHGVFELEGTYSQKKRKLYPKKSFDEALKSIQDQKLTLAKASQQYGIPASTLRSHVNGRCSGSSTGPPRTLKDEDEKMLADYLKHRTRLGFPPKRADIRKLILSMVENHTRSGFNSEGPSDKWFRSFYARHPELLEGRENTCKTRQAPDMENFCLICDFEHRLANQKSKMKRTNVKKEPQQGSVNGERVVNREQQFYGQSYSPMVEGEGTYKPGTQATSEVETTTDQGPVKVEKVLGGPLLVYIEFDDRPDTEEEYNKILSYDCTRCEHLSKQDTRSKIKIVKSRKLYPEADLLEALHLIRDQTMTVSQAAKQYGIPDSTLRGHIKGRYTRTTSGPLRQLDEEQEERLVNHITTFAPLSRMEIRKFIMKMITEDGKLQSTSFNTDRGPSHKWFRSFYKRHPELYGLEEFAKRPADNNSTDSESSDEENFEDDVKIDKTQTPENSASNFLEQEFPSSSGLCSPRTPRSSQKRSAKTIDDVVVKKHCSAKIEHVEEALENVLNHSRSSALSDYETAQDVKINIKQKKLSGQSEGNSSIRDRSGQRSSGQTRGPKRTLSEEEEEVLVYYIKNCDKPVSRAQMRKFVLSLIKASGKISSTTFNVERGPSDKWFRGFYTRHPELLHEEQGNSNTSNDFVDGDDSEEEHGVQVHDVGMVGIGEERSSAGEIQETTNVLSRAGRVEDGYPGAKIQETTKSPSKKLRKQETPRKRRKYDYDQPNLEDPQNVTSEPLCSL